MAEEFTVNFNTRFQPASGFDSGQVNFASNKKFTITGTRYTRTIQSVGFSAREAIDLGEISAPGFLIVRNLDTVNFVNVFIDASSGAGFAKLLPGEFCVVPLHASAAAPGVQADTAACLCEIQVIER